MISDEKPTIIVILTRGSPIGMASRNAKSKMLQYALGVEITLGGNSHRTAHIQVGGAGGRHSGRKLFWNIMTELEKHTDCGQAKFSISLT